MHISVVSIFPEMFTVIKEFGIVGRAIRERRVELDLINLRDYGLGAYQQLDDRPFGGGPGMVMLAEPIIRCVSDLRKQKGTETPVIYMSPQGQKLEQKHVGEFLEIPHMILLCGRYEGVDQRALDIIRAQEWSIGDYVLSGGEIPAMVLIDCITRQVDGVLGNSESKQSESFVNGLLDCQHYTRPQSVRGRSVPEILLSGHHEAIRRWRLKQAVGRTWQRRPDLLEHIELSQQEQQLLREFENEQTVMEKSS